MLIDVAFQARNPDVYKGLFGGKNCRDSPVQPQRQCTCTLGSCRAADSYAEDVKEILEYSIPKHGVAAFIAESIQVSNGFRKIKKKM